MNEEQIAYWNGPGAARWVAQQEVLDRSLQLFGTAAIAAAGVQTAERVLDVGCGCGDSALTLARQVGPLGSVLGLDVSEPMLARARERAAGLPQLQFKLGDAASVALSPEFDVLYSRFGVMFFEEPGPAFAHLATALRPGGRIAFVCWRAYEENPWARVPSEVVRRVAPDVPDLFMSSGPGPYAFADRAELERLLRSVGLRDVAIARFDADVVLSNAGLDEAVEFAMNAGPPARLLAGAPSELRVRAQEALARELAPYRGPNGYALGGSSWIVTARGPREHT